MVQGCAFLFFQTLWTPEPEPCSNELNFTACGEAFKTMCRQRIIVLKKRSDGWGIDEINSKNGQPVFRMQGGKVGNFCIGSSLFFGTIIHQSPCSQCLCFLGDVADRGLNLGPALVSLVDQKTKPAPLWAASLCKSLGHELATRFIFMMFDFSRKAYPQNR